MSRRFQKATAARLSWPRPRGKRGRAACPFCDTLHDAPRVGEGEAVHCSRCDHVIYQNRPASLARASAFSLAALVLLILAQCFPFLTLEAAGIQRQLTLLNAASELVRNDAPILGCSVVLFTILAPLFLIGGMIYATTPLLYGHSAPFASQAVKWLYRAEPWNMVEVFMLGVLVSLLKLAKVAEVSINAGFWSFAGVMLCIAGAMAGIDRRELWDRIELAGQR